MTRKLVLVLFTLTLTLALASLASAQGNVPERTDRTLPSSIDELKLDAPIQLDGVDAALLQTAATVGADDQYIVRLSEPSISDQKAKGNQAKAAKRQIESQQSAVLRDIQRLDPNAKVIGQTQLVLNAVFVEVDPAVVGEIADLPGVKRVVPVSNYELDLSETVPYIGGTGVQGMGYDGTGVKVAVLDSGVDYTHAALGGPGTLAAYEDAWGTSLGDSRQTTRDGLFPTAKVVEGYDFVGEQWPSGPLAPDEDPIDFEGHGTHVADIIGGSLGVAPGVDLYAVKVCSAVASSCSGIALIQGMEYSVDPDGDGDPSDRVDVINMSLGSTYGQPFDDDLAAAVEGATGLGVLTVASAGNSADKPYANGTPAAAPSALSVAQTAVPSEFLPYMTVVSPASIAGDYTAVFQPWSAPLLSVIEYPLQYGDGAGGNLLGCAAFPAGSLAGKIVLVDRGDCSFSIKIFNIQQGGGEAGIIGLVAPGDPFTGGFGGGGPFTIPGYMISQADSNMLKANLGAGVVVRFDPDNGLPLVGSVVGSSSRGPQHEDTTWIKPEIGAPGASVSAIAGSGTDTGPFGGTSGAAPMVSGSAALLLQAEPNLGPAESKARLMNTAETEIYNSAGGPLAPITRIGGGEVRVDRAVATQVSAWDDATLQGGLSYGFVDIDKNTVVLTKKVRVRNYSDQNLTFNVTSEFRYADDAALKAVQVRAPKKVNVRAGKDATFTVQLRINGTKLLGNYMNSGSMGANPAGLTLNEIDGYLRLTAGEQEVHMPWHVLPRKASNVVGRSVLNLQSGTDTISLNNNGVGTAQNDAYSLLAISEDLPEGGFGQQSPTPDIRAVGINTFPVPAGFCSASPSFIWAFAINTWERQQHLLPVSHQVWLDTNQDGTDDYVILNRDASGLGTISDGRQLAWVLNLSTGSASAFFFAEHSMNTGNTVLLLCGEQIGMNAADLLVNTTDMYVVAQDFYFGGPGDLIEGLTVTPLGEQYVGIPEDIAGRSVGTLEVMDYGPFSGNTPELGLMLVTNGDRGAGARGGATQSTEALLFTP